MGRSLTSTGGDVVYSRILTRGAAGLVTDGAVRDGHRVTAYGFPVFACGSTPTVGEPFILPYSVNEPIQCGGVLVCPGDVLIGDEEGVVVLPAQLADEVADQEDARETVELGAIGYWPPGAALCLFFGPTPASRRGEIRPASPVNLLGMIERDATALKAARAGDEITVQRA